MIYNDLFQIAKVFGLFFGRVFFSVDLLVCLIMFLFDPRLSVERCYHFYPSMCKPFSIRKIVTLTFSVKSHMKHELPRSET